MTAPRKTLPLTLERLMEVLRLNQDTGRFMWLKHYHSRMVGREAGSPTKGGYRKLTIDGIHYMEHRVVWFYCNGAWPATELDHRDLNKMNNRIGNLREGDHAFNCQNQKHGHAGSKTGVLGTSVVNGKFTAHIGINGKKRHLGSFPTIELAQAAYLEAKRQLHAGSTL